MTYDKYLLVKLIFLPVSDTHVTIVKNSFATAMSWCVISVAIQETSLSGAMTAPRGS